MTNATPRTLAALHNRTTSYEVVLSHPERGSVVVGFTARRTRRGILDAVQSRGDEILAHTNIGNDPVTFGRAPAWTITFGSTGWTVAFSGRTEREARILDEA